MGLYKWWQVTWVIVVSLLLLSSLVEVEGSKTYDPESLDAFLWELTHKEEVKLRTGVFYNISLPANFTSMEVSVIRLRTASLWFRGVNFSFFYLPPGIVPEPNWKRMAILYENLGNWSSHYYNVPNYTMVAPVLGFMAYNSSETTLIGSEKMNLTIQRHPITIRFPQMGSQARNETPICAKFGVGGSVEFSNMTEPYVCEAKSQGHYTLVVPSPKSQSKSKSSTLWWVLGFVMGFVGLVLLVLVLLVIVKLAKRRKIRKLERNLEGGEPFDTFWIGGTKLPIAAMIRTKPVLENDEVVPH